MVVIRNVSWLGTQDHICFAGTGVGGWGLGDCLALGLGAGTGGWGLGAGGLHWGLAVRAGTGAGDITLCPHATTGVGECHPPPLL